ncbi:MAG: HAMP domain-containing sensor histidine kinase [Hydrogenophaga sp.]|nr:HAMP domain-containing sensor histidine kinase [Hydrogenophaga sp.]
MERLVHAPLEPILHPSRFRLVWIGLFTLLGHLLFTLIWGRWIPQPYENLAVRLLMAFLALIYLCPSILKDPGSALSRWLFSLATWIQLPCFFTWMYLMNGGNAVWLASMVAMVLIYFHVTDWRLASVGLLCGALAGWALAEVATGGSLSVAEPATGAVVLSFAGVMGLLLGFSSANLRRVRLINTLSTMGVMAHELRTPLATVNLLADVLRNLARSGVSDGTPQRLEDLASRLQHLVRSMNRQIDTQISNAQLLRLPRDQARIDAAALVNEVVRDYPYRSDRERDCVCVQIQQDFQFQGSPALFGQVLSNLLKNALHALASAPQAPAPGSLRIDVGLHQGLGRIAVSDDGVGIPYAHQHRIFEPFYSTQTGVGSGLGLSFCKNVVESAQGSLSLLAEPGLGAVFLIDLPLAPLSPDNASA